MSKDCTVTYVTNDNNIGMFRRIVPSFSALGEELQNVLNTNPNVRLINIIIGEEKHD